MRCGRVWWVSGGGQGGWGLASAVIMIPHTLPTIITQGKAYLDALPYIDGEMDPGMRARVDKLILEEMQNPRFPRKYVHGFWLADAERRRVDGHAGDVRTQVCDKTTVVISHVLSTNTETTWRTGRPRKRPLRRACSSARSWSGWPPASPWRRLTRAGRHKDEMCGRQRECDGLEWQERRIHFGPGATD